MKLILAILRDPIHEEITQVLNNSGFRVTLVASTSGWLKKGLTTLLIGVDDDQVEAALACLRANCPVHEDPQSHNATIFVLKSSGFEHF